MRCTELTSPFSIHMWFKDFSQVFASKFSQVTDTYIVSSLLNVLLLFSAKNKAGENVFTLLFPIAVFYFPIIIPKTNQMRVIPNE